MKHFAFWKHGATVAVSLWSAAMFVLAAKSGIQHDYASYLGEWKLVLSGNDPWSTNNAYGPLHNLIAYLLPFGWFGPKLFIVGSLVAANALLVHELMRTKATTGDYVRYVLTVPSNVLIISMGATYGLNDSLVAAFVMLAVALRLREKDFAAGAVLGFAVLLKYYPVLLVPLFALDRERFRGRLVLSAVAVTVLGLAVAIGIWGQAPLQALYFGTDRGPKILSILSALEGQPALVGGPSVLAFLIRANAAFVVAVEIIAIVLARALRLHWLEASVLGYLAVCLTYKVGHQQFYIPWLFLVAALPLAGTSSARRLAWLCLPFALFLSIFQWGYAYGSDGYHEVLGVVRRDVGFFAFPFGIATIAAYFLARRRTAAGSGRKQAVT